MNRLEDLEKIILESDNIPEEVILERQYLLNDSTKEVDFSSIENLFIKSIRRCKEKAKKIYECLPNNIEDWYITGKLNILPETELLSKLFSRSNPFYKEEKFEIFLCSKNDAKEILYNQKESKITLMPWKVQVLNELYIFTCLHKFPAQDLLGIKEIHTEVVLECYE